VRETGEANEVHLARSEARVGDAGDVDDLDSTSVRLMALSGDSAGARAAAARGAVPAVAGIIVAVALDRNRLFTSAQLLPELIGDPFGRGWDPFGWADATLDAAPLGAEGLLWAQLAMLGAGHAVGAVVAARPLERRSRGPIALGLSLLAGASVLAVASH
jgi:hypothetical protein